MSVEIICEPGCTAEGDHDRIMALIDAAAEAGATCFKNQFCSNPAKLVQRRRVPESYLVPYGWLAYPLHWHHEFASACHELGLLYGCSTVLPEDVAALKPYVDLLKLPSFEALAPDMLAAHEDAGGRLIISTGMCSAEDVAFLDGWRRRGNNVNRRVDLLHCTSSYPAPLEDLNLRVLQQPWCDGLSDHSRHVATGGLAVMQGARVIEAHLRLHECDPHNPDCETAFNPDEFAAYVACIRGAQAGILEQVADAEPMLGDGVKRPMSSEAEMAKYRVTS